MLVIMEGKSALTGLWERISRDILKAGKGLYGDWSRIFDMGLRL